MLTTAEPLKFKRSLLMLFLFQFLAMLMVGLVITLFTDGVKLFTLDDNVRRVLGVLGMAYAAAFFGNRQEKKQPGALGPHIKKMSLMITLMYGILSFLYSFFFYRFLHQNQKVNLILSTIALVSLMFVIYLSTRYGLFQGIKYAQKKAITTKVE